MKNLIALIMGTAFLIMSGCAQRIDIEAERTAIRNADAEWSKAAAAKDADGFTAFVVENGSILIPNAPIRTGSEAIRQWASETMANPGFAVSWQATAAEVSAAGDLGYTVGTYDFTLHDPQGNPMTDRGKYVTVWKKQPDGKWKVAVDIFNSDLPPPVAATAQQ
jgi:ketosteroid isomerase-like protein